jgi:hypothetical protein
MKKPLDKFGEFFVRNTRDKMLFDLHMLLRGEWKAPALRPLQKKISKLSAAEKEVVREMVEHITTGGMHDFLFALQEHADDADGSVRLIVDGVEVAKLSDGMHGEIFGEDGWIARFSEYPQREKG